jgi:excisionase family DNA binding protein
MKVADIRALLNKERYEALDVRDPIAIAQAAERFNVLDAVLASHHTDEVMDLYKPVLSVSQAAKLLGYKPKEVRRLLGQGKISGKKVGNEWRVPLKAVL